MHLHLISWVIALKVDEFHPYFYEKIYFWNAGPMGKLDALGELRAMKER